MAKQTGFELWDMESRNLVDDYDSEEQALSALVAATNRYGDAYAARLSLVAVGPRGKLHEVASGQLLVARIKARRTAIA
jgi:hypothetical protein